MSDRVSVARSLAALRQTVAAWHRAGLTVGLVPTMGALHEGHLSLVRISKARADRTVASLFVNPTQFAPGEDFDAYPRDEAADLALFAAAGTDLVYAPQVGELYPEGHASTVGVDGVSQILEGASRPHFFTGVATVVAMLFNQVQADCAVFGEKDYQQLCVIRKMVRDLHMPVEVIGGPTVREADGLAMSSRNRYLSAAERRIAPRLHQLLVEIGARFRAGGTVADLAAWGAADLADAGFGRLDYIDIRTADTLTPVTDRDCPVRVLAAVWLGRARLIDNVAA